MILSIIIPESWYELDFNDWIDKIHKKNGGQYYKFSETGEDY